ncbi:transthyretin-like protein-like protein [Halenospora varia]|nr:transthyretin-like protein-like protein [Halenospora varia]
MSPPERDPITCHVLDTTTGRPAANISVKLSCLSIPDIIFVCETNSDGRIANWRNEQGSRQGEGAFHMITTYGQAETPLPTPAGSSAWKLEFDTGSYYGPTNVFFPKVELTFLVKEGEHFHVPLLLGPYSFTTYRGS